MQLHFYWFEPEKGRVYTKTAAVVETEKTYKSEADAYFPFMYKRKMLKTEIGIVSASGLGFVCVLDEANSATAKNIFHNYLNRAYGRAMAEAEQFDGYLKSLEGAEWTEEP